MLAGSFILGKIGIYNRKSNPDSGGDGGSRKESNEGTGKSRGEYLREKYGKLSSEQLHANLTIGQVLISRRDRRIIN